ncbi:hypothetical protein E3N88_04918 [Mikania micrantha]|uniref:CCHC-type domain-containing protein n=1 Tax=Mikania micrantha TaxID=192012 RepID=A0A5N6PYI4_9ASTR|nr:hypothetical protein E3N88_04918 [Mikania micrantha]
MEVKEKERTYEFLMGLGAEFSVIRTQILAIKPTPTVGATYHLVAEDERQRNIMTEKKVDVDVAAFQAWQPTKKAPLTSKKPTWQKDKGQSTTKAEHCTHCGKDGHIREGCFKRIGYPDWWPTKGKKELSKPKAAMVDGGPSPIPGLDDEQYEVFLKFFGKKEGPSKDTPFMWLIWQRKKTPLAHYVSYENFLPNHKAFLSAITSNDEPKTFHQASHDNNLKEAMRKEIKALEQNNTWSLEYLPEGKRAIDSKWIYKIKYKSNGEVERYKA